MKVHILLAALLMTAPAFAQDGQVYFRRKSNQQLIGPSTELQPTNCKTAADGSVSCDVKIVNPSDPNNRYRSQDR